ncbi:Peptidyl-prolyl cis-trans isomerase [Nymphaea thermarum]|nr:Peptidyl-prolyl cis-trans isomerase [Nymphaea thermarum]
MMMNPLVRSFHNPAHLCSVTLSSKHHALAADHQHHPCLQPRKPPLPIGQTLRVNISDEQEGGSTSSSATHTRRRVLTQVSSLVFLASLGSCSAGSLPLIPPAQADELPPERDCSDPSDVTQKVYLEVSIDGRPAGRVVIGLDGKNAPAGTARFVELVSGKAGVSYRRKEFLRIMPNYVQNAGVRSYGIDSEMARRRKGRIGLVADELIAEWADTNREKRNGCGGLDTGAGGVVGIIVRDPYKPPPKLKVVARKGKLEIDEEQEREDPNGTEFVITTKSAPELGPSTLVVGKVLEGMEVVDAISRVPTVQDNTSSPYFRVAKLIGDKRAVVAERGFNRPYSKVVVTNCGMLN